MHFEYWSAGDGWHWHLKSRNNVIVAGSVDAYTREVDCVRAIRQMIRTLRWGLPGIRRLGPE